MNLCSLSLHQLNLFYWQAAPAAPAPAAAPAAPAPAAAPAAPAGTFTDIPISNIRKVSTNARRPFGCPRRLSRLPELLCALPSLP